VQADARAQVVGLRHKLCHSSAAADAHTKNTETVPEAVTVVRAKLHRAEQDLKGSRKEEERTQRELERVGGDQLADRDPA